MADASEKPEHDLVFDQKSGEIRQVSPLTRRLVENNPGPFTFTGTCTYIVGQGEVAVIDPGTGRADHLDAILAAVKNERISYILATHTHRDHCAGARALAERCGAPIIGCAPYAPPDKPGAGLDSSHDHAYKPDRVLREGEAVSGPGYRLTALETPGHAANHLCFAFKEENALFSGDHVMAWSTSVVAPPDGSMRQYRQSLEKLRARDDRVYWPGHGGPVRQPYKYVCALLDHRRQREDAILSRIAAGDATIEQMVANIYQGLDQRLIFAASLSVFAHIEELLARKAIRSESEPGLNGRFYKI